MQNTYQDYLEKPKAFTVEQFAEIHKQLLDAIGEDEEGQELYDDFVKIATQYGRIRAEWNLLSRDQKRDQNDGRTACHDSIIVHVNMLARYLKNQGKDVTWRETLGDPEEDRYNRKCIGDFACYVVFVNSVCAR